MNQHAYVSDLAEGGAGQARIRVAPVQMVQGVERLEPQLQVSALGKTEVLLQRGVDIEDPRARSCVAAEIASCTLRLKGEGRRVKPLARILRRDWQIRQAPRPAYYSREGVVEKKRLVFGSPSWTLLELFAAIQVPKEQRRYWKFRVSPSYPIPDKVSGLQALKEAYDESGNT